MVASFILLLGSFSLLGLPTTWGQAIAFPALYSRVYLHIASAAPCSRHLTTKGQFGCSANGELGELIYLQTQADVEALLDPNVSSGGGGPYAAMLPSALFTLDNVNALSSESRVAGLLVLLQKPDVAPTLNAAPFPNSEEGSPVNPGGQSLFTQDLRLPIFGVPSSSSQALLRAIERQPRENWHVDFSARQAASKDSVTCLRRGFCDPVGGFSVYSFGMFREEDEGGPQAGKERVLAVAGWDSRSTFTELVVGAGRVANAVVVMAAAEALKNRSGKPLSDFEDEVVYFFPAAQAWDNMGSRKFSADLRAARTCEKGPSSSEPTSPTCPLPIRDQIDRFTCFVPCRRSRYAESLFDDARRKAFRAAVEVNQVTGIGTALTSDDRMTIYAHGGLPVEEAGDLGVPGNATVTYLVTNRNLDGRLPPYSALPDLGVAPEISVIFSEIQERVLNPFFSTALDDSFAPENVGVACHVATTVARTLYRQANPSEDSSPANLTADCELVETLMTCLIRNVTCDFVGQYFNVSPSTPERPNAHTGVYFRGISPGITTRLIHDFMVDQTTPDFEDSVLKECDVTRQCDRNRHEECVRGRCRRSWTAYHETFGSGFDDEFHVEDFDGNTWTESM